MMTSGIAVRKSIMVEVPQAHAFDVWVHQQGKWWPKEHCLGEAPLQDAIIEPRVGGRWHEIDSKGAQCNWGRVVAYDPVSRIVLAWQITADWKYDTSIYTEVEVRFIPEGPNKTRVELEHRGLEAYGDDAEKMRQLFERPEAWQLSLERFAQTATAA